MPVKEAEHADDKAARLALARFQRLAARGRWQRPQAAGPLLEGRRRLGPSKCGNQPETVLSELDDLEGLSQDQLQAALAPPLRLTLPL